MYRFSDQTEFIKTFKFNVYLLKRIVISNRMNAKPNSNYYLINENNFHS